LASGSVADMSAGLEHLRLQLVDCARVPVLTIFASCASGDLVSLDLTIDQPLGELHVRWFLSQLSEAELEPTTCDGVPTPRFYRFQQGREAAVLRLIKWWLRRRHIPVSKEGGYPTITWTLMVMHVLRCSLFLNDGGLDERALLGAVAAFFDRFGEAGPAGTLMFVGSSQAQFCHQLPSEHAKNDQVTLPPAADLCVLDPTDMPSGIEAADLAPRLSAATRLLHAYELRRAARLSASALHGCSNVSGEDDVGGGAALRSLFEELGEAGYTVPTQIPPSDPDSVLAAFVLLDGELHLGKLQSIEPKPGWTAPFLHRADQRSRLTVQMRRVDTSTGAVIALSCPIAGSVRRCAPADFVCTVRLTRCRSSSQLYLERADINRWCDMHALWTNSESFSLR